MRKVGRGRSGLTGPISMKKLGKCGTTVPK